MKHGISTIWEKNPALLFGLTFFLGCLFALQTLWAACFLIFVCHPKYIFKVTLTFLLPIILIYQFYSFPPTGSEVEGHFYTHSIRKSERFGNGWVYKGVLKTDRGKICCSCFSKTYFSPYKIYKVKGKLRSRDGKFYSLKTKAPWESLKSRFSLAETRLTAKERVKEYIEKATPQPRAAQFLTGMVTGQLEDRVMLKEFGQLGLSHIMAISGFHFALLTLAFHLFLRLFLPHKLEAFVLISVLTLYFLFIGDSPSISRAWTVAIVFLVGQLLEKRPTALNSLGAAMLFSLMTNPLYACTLSFQLSFLATGGILALLQPCSKLLNLWIPKLSISEVIQKKVIWQQGYIAASLLRESLSLTLAVHIVLIPLLLHSFHTFSINSLIYNLFFPFLASIALFVFLVGVVLGGWVHYLNGYYCEWVLKITETPPVLFRAFYAETFPPAMLSLIFAGLLFIAMKVQKRT